ncbi:hypothetical protein D917_03593 [Trichinella nativa]|uniref:RNase H type-1 domain-containing protein n=1 Tax=Trichinella nativa TaxID=6335 RepID=A0A1Y3EBD3_9BILA|nr:hypothetical protein D917_03593 [Trichinella nativa]
MPSKGLNLALSWQMRRIRLMTDSATVHRWVTDGLSGKARLKTKASGVRIRDGSRPCEVRVQQGKRINPIAAAVVEATAAGPALVCAATADLGVERMIADVRQVISVCEPCKSLDPAPGKWKGSLEVEEVWQRVGMDITHVRGGPYLTLIDCRPSRFAVWQRLRVHCSANVIEVGGGVLQTGAPESPIGTSDFSRIANCRELLDSKGSTRMFCK